MAIILQETQRALFYMPLYAAFALGAYRKEGLEVALKSSSRPEDAIRSVTAGTADVGWGGPMRVIVAHDRQPDSDVVCFCEVVARDPFFLVGRTACNDFKLASLFDVRLGVVREVPTPWCCLQNDLRREGLNPMKLNLGPSRSMTDNVMALREGEVDVIQVFEPFATELVSEGMGHVWYEAANRGPTTYTSFYARRPVLHRRSTEFRLMTHAIYRTLKWAHLSSAAEIAYTVAEYFPEVREELLRLSIANYQRLNIWGTTPHLSKAGFDMLKSGLLSSKLVSTAVPFEIAVDNTFASDVISADPAAFPQPSQ